MFRFADSKDDFDTMRDEAIANKGLVIPGLAEKEVNVVSHENMSDGRLHPFDMTLNETKRKRNIQDYASEHGLTGEVDVEGGRVKISRSTIGEFVDDKHINKSVKNGVPRDVHVAVVLDIKRIIENSIDCEIYPDRLDKDENGTRKAEGEYSKTTLMHVFYCAVNIGGKYYSVRTLIKETKGNSSNKAYVYSLEEIEVYDGHNRAVESEPLRKSEPSISGAKLLQGVEKSYDEGKKLLDERKKIRVPRERGRDA